MFCHFRPNKRFSGKSCHAYSFEDNEKYSRSKRCKINSATKLLTLISKQKLILTIKTIEVNTPKIPTTFKIKTEIYVIELSALDMPNLNSIAPFLAKLWQKKLLKIYYVKFSNSILAVTEHTKQAKDYWISCDELHRIDTPFMQNINSEI